MADELVFPPWSLNEVALMVVVPTDEVSFLKANSAAVHPVFTPDHAWQSGNNWTNELVSNARSLASKSQAETDIPGAHPAVLLLRRLPKNGGAYLFGRSRRDLKLDVVLPDHYVSRRQFCVYPNLLHRTWVIQDLSGKGTTAVNDHMLRSAEGDQAPPRRALQYDRLTRVVIAESAPYPGLTLYIQPIWPEDSNYLHWEWRDRDIPELGSLNLNSTMDFTSPTATRSQNPRLHGLSAPEIYCVLKRRFSDNEVFYGQNLSNATMLAAEKFSSTSEAREQFDMRQLLKSPHFLKLNDLCFLDHPYILTDCPHGAETLTDFILGEPLNDRAIYILLNGILSAIEILFKNGVAHGAVTPGNILVADLSPEHPRFWLTGFSSARSLSVRDIEQGHSADVYMAMQTIAGICDGSDYFKDPVANSIFTGFMQALQSGPLSAKDILREFKIFTQEGRVDFPLKSGNLKKKFSVNQILFDGQAYYRKNELALVARAHFAQGTKEFQTAAEKILRLKPSGSSPAHMREQLIHCETARKVFSRLDPLTFFEFKPKFGPKSRRESNRIQEFPVSFQIIYHAPSSMWNLSQLLNSIRPTGPLEIGNLDHCVEVGGDARYEGVYVDLDTFRKACQALGVSPPPQPSKSNIDPRASQSVGVSLPPKYSESDIDPRASQFRSVNCSKGGLVLVEEKLLLGTAIFQRSSKTMRYANAEYSEANVIQLFTPHTFEGLHRGIQSRCPPRSMEELYQGQPAQEFPQSQCQSLSESSDDPIPRFNSRKKARPSQGQENHPNLTEHWVNEQARTRRYRPTADIRQFRNVDGKLLPVNDESKEAAYSSSSSSDDGHFPAGMQAKVEQGAINTKRTSAAPDSTSA